ncbi:hypothetical protein HanRHA438_Chr09g0394061 [Helianthus annuus]|nr:hypothetical protein HanIR_Chr09g0412271 [Helianthus annuus]KAJ0887717.1 hypothetical protein HanRHA438_Chr09g0394061 [Helianthus annuus]
MVLTNALANLLHSIMGLFLLLLFTPIMIFLAIPLIFLVFNTTIMPFLLPITLIPQLILGSILVLLFSVIQLI